MMFRVRTYIALLVSTLLVLTGHSAAVARKAPDAVDRMVICAGERIETVLVDASGAPVAPQHFCPDCVLDVGAVFTPPVRLPVRQAFAPCDPDLSVDLDVHQVFQHRRAARGPPGPAPAV